MNNVKDLAIEVLERARKFVKTSDTLYVKNDEIRSSIKDLGGHANNRMKRNQLISELESLLGDYTVESLISDIELSNALNDSNSFCLGVFGSNNYSDYHTLSVILDYLLSNKHGQIVVLLGYEGHGINNIVKQYAKEHGHEFYELPNGTTEGIRGVACFFGTSDIQGDFAKSIRESFEVPVKTFDYCRKQWYR